MFLAGITSLLLNKCGDGILFFEDIGGFYYYYCGLNIFEEFDDELCSSSTIYG